VADRSRIDDLRRRVDDDPASIAFAQLAEEYRRAGDFEEAVRVCRTGLAQHPAYLSARVTLGRALMELRRYDEARTELEYVLHASPDNASAVRALSDIRQAIERLASEARGQAVPGQTAAGPAAPPEPAYSLDPNDDPFARALASLDAVAVVPPEAPAVLELEQWLARIQTDRQRRVRRGGA
jgi:tetratricopeptide (TPR) repeat protein